MKLVTQKNTKILITRKTYPSLRITAQKLMMDIIQENGFYHEANHQKSDRIYRYDSNFIYFSALDTPEKIKSSEFTDIWMEEANEFTYEDFMQLKLRMSGKSDGINQIFLSLNPSDDRSWVRQLENREDANLIISSYRDNPFLNADYVTELEKLKGEDDEYWRVYGEGEWGQKSNLIYPKYKVVDDFKNYSEILYGLDFGYNVPTALVEIRFNGDEGIIYTKEILYETKLTNSDLIEKLKYLVDKNIPIYADCAEPQRIKEIENEGYIISPSDKRVKVGIDYVKSFDLYINRESPNLIKEFNGYKWKKNKMGEMLDEPVKYNDHLLDAMRYAIYTNINSLISSKYYFWIKNENNKYNKIVN